MKGPRYVEARWELPNGEQLSVTKCTRHPYNPQLCEFVVRHEARSRSAFTPTHFSLSQAKECRAFLEAKYKELGGT